ncbi:hypothetical protein [Wolbachia endosymbiont of Trichogramma kaykai]|uniref:hypothetical protein n=1 Tax=Wolbachia endosymbiont of Trichogramma kaykai TaxID=444066 RepID=UPI003891FB2E
MIILVSAITGLIATIMGFYVATSLVHCVDGSAITFAASATSITDSKYVGISQEEEVDECITSPTVKKVSSAKETMI